MLREIENLKCKLNLATALIEFRIRGGCKLSVLDLILKRYNNATLLLSTRDFDTLKFGDFTILGGTRALADTNSDWEDKELFSSVYEVEKAFKKLFDIN